MAEPISSTAGATVGAGLVVSTFLGFVLSVDYLIVFGAFAGSVFFIVTATNLTRKQIVSYFIFAYACGLFGAGFAADWVEKKLSYREKPLDALTAVIISAGAVHAYFWIKNGGLRMSLYRGFLLGLITPEKMRTGFMYLNSKGFVSNE